MRPPLALLMVACAATAACDPVARGGQPPHSPERPGAEPIQVAVTIDDLPVHGPAPPGVTRLAMTERLLAAFAAHHLPPVHGFVNGKRVDDDPATEVVLRRWVAAGQQLGNHAWSHPSLNGTALDLRAALADPFYTPATHAPVPFGSALPYVLAQERGLNVDPPVWARGLEAQLRTVCRPPGEAPGP